MFSVVNQPLYEVTSPPQRLSGFPFVCGECWDLPTRTTPSHTGYFSVCKWLYHRVQLNHPSAVPQRGKQPFLCNPVWRDRQQMSTAKNISFSCVWCGAEKEGLWEGGSYCQMLWIFICAQPGIQEITGEW